MCENQIITDTASLADRTFVRPGHKSQALIFWSSLGIDIAETTEASSQIICVVQSGCEAGRLTRRMR